MTLRIGIDTGGTFTDVVAFDTDSESLHFLKVHSTPDDPGRAVMQGVVEATRKTKIGAEAVDLIVHGTTVATNVVLQRAGARVALITTAGFGDVLQIQRQNRPRLYDMRARRPEPLIAREMRYELTERMLYDGTVQTPVDRAQLDDIVRSLRARKIDGVAVCFLHSYVDPRHELEVGRVLAEKLPGLTVCLSHELGREHGEYERFSTCAINAYVQPVMERYLGRLSHDLQRERVASPLFVMKSNGGVTSADVAARQCINTILSGPAGGVVAGLAIAGHHTNRNLITADMGGTSFDVAVMHDGGVSFAREGRIAGLALLVPMLDLHTVGAGGGSIGWIDAGGSLRVGPRSAGAVPGPACYGRGGTEPTVTDANLILGRLACGSTLAGGIELDLDASQRVVNDRLAGPMGLSIETAAEGMIRVVNTTMVAAVRKLTVERGHDPRRFTLCAFGGAGPLHGAELAREMSIPETLIPLAPGVTSAMGLLMCDLREDRVRTCVQLLDQAEASHVERLFEQLQTEAQQHLTARSSDAASIRSTRRIGLRYHGQSHDVPVDVAAGPLDLQAIGAAFHTAHEKRYGYCRRDEPVELVNLWASEAMDLEAVKLPHVPSTPDRSVPVRSRRVVFEGQAYDTAVYQRDGLGAGARFCGPAIVEQDDSTVAVLPGQNARVDQYGQIILESLSMPAQGRP